jgi:hypothetical protein
MTIIKIIGIMILQGLICACNGQWVKEDVPAYITNPSEKSRIELERAVSKALNGIPVTLADNVLTKDNRLIIERKPHVDAKGNLIMGLETEMPRQFRLVKNKGKCILIDQSNGNRMELKQTVCKALN